MNNSSCGLHTLKDVEHNLHTLRKADPAGILPNQKKFSDALMMRYSILKDQVKKEVQDKDGFALTGAVLLSSGMLDRLSDVERMAAFESWFTDMLDHTVLYNEENSSGKWTDSYISSAWDKGAGHASADIEDRDLPLGDDDPVFSVGLATAAGMVTGMLLSRTWSEMEGISDAVRQKAMRTVADGLQNKWSPEQITNGLLEDISKIGDRRSDMLARTETMRAAVRGATSTYRLNKITTLQIMAEWMTMQDARVCSQCKGYEGHVYTLDQIDAMLPAHTLCRCWIRIVS